MAIVKSVSTVQGQEVTIYVEVDELPEEKDPYDDPCPNTSILAPNSSVTVCISFSVAEVCSF
jgi:hypothetical protein